MSVSPFPSQGDDEIRKIRFPSHSIDQETDYEGFVDIAFDVLMIV